MDIVTVLMESAIYANRLTFTTNISSFEVFDAGIMMPLNTISSISIHTFC